MRILEASGNLARKRASHPVQTQLDAPMTTTDSIASVVLAPSGVLTEERLVVDVRTPGEYEEAHIEGSLHVPLGGLAPTAPRLAELAGDRPITLVCRSGKRAEEGRRLLLRSGLEQAECLEGGIEAWIATGHPVRRGEGTAMSLERQVRIAAGTLVALGSAATWLLDPAWIALPAFVGSGLVFAGITDTCGMGLLLARMPWNRRSSSGSSRALAS